MAEETKEEAKTTKKASPKAKKQTLQTRNPKSKLGLRTKSGKTVLMTVEEALKPHNFKKLVAKHQKLLTEGVSIANFVNNQ